MVNTQPYLVVSGVFGPTIQGEGPAAGRHAAFIRLMGCNLTCSWCDTPYTWDGKNFDLKSEGTRMLWEDVIDRVLETGARLVVITGGEPLLQQVYSGWRDLLRGLKEAGLTVHIETNGTVVPSSVTLDCVDQFVVSPKLPNAGMPLKRTVNAKALRMLKNRSAHFKFVCRDVSDVVLVHDLIREHSIPSRRTWIMPEGKTAPEICDHLAQIADTAVLHGFNITSRLHILAWGDERGR